MRLVDTHCHLNFPEYKDDLDSVMDRAVSSSVEAIIIPGTSAESSESAVELAIKNKRIYAACGIHPHDADKYDREKDIKKIKDLALKSNKVVAIGEIGLDYYKKYSDPKNQKVLLETCLDVARDFDFPVIFHNRDAEDDFLEIIKKRKSHKMRGVVHCFSGTMDFLKKVIESGLHVSFTGNITFDKSGRINDLIKNVPTERLMLETDSPFLAPVPLRGKRNEPANVRHIASVIAELLSLSIEDVARFTTFNANRLFRLGFDEEVRIAYPIRNTLYLNITNRCTDRCVFCAIDTFKYVKGHNLTLTHEPDTSEIIKSLGDLAKYDEITFCGYGEPTLRLNTIKEVAAFIKKSGKKIRLVTNGEANLINSRPIAGELKGLIDRVSVSLNAPDPAKYNKICKPFFEGNVFDSVIEFIRECVSSGLDVEVTCLDFIGEEDTGKCRSIAEGLGARFRLRRLNETG